MQRILSINNQGQRNSCCGNAADKALEWDAWVESRTRINLSARFSYLAGRQWSGINNGPDVGLSIEAGAMGAHEFGTVPEESFPYWKDYDRFDPHLPPEIVKLAAMHCAGAVARAHTAEEIVERLGTGQGATIFGITWTSGLASYRGGQPIGWDPGGRTLGGHALCFCDYETIDGKLFLRVWNSHGNQWGDRGTMLVAANLVNAWLNREPYGAYTVTDLSGFKKRKRDLLASI
jgi:hypothetical protein